MYLLALSGVRGAEVFLEPPDEHCKGLIWKDVDFGGGPVQVFGKSREFERAHVPSPALERLERWRRVIDPAISTSGVRYRMRRIFDEEEMDVDGEYLEPQGIHLDLVSCSGE